MQCLTSLGKITLLENVSLQNYSNNWLSNGPNEQETTNYMVLGTLNKVVKSNFVQISTLIFKVHIIGQNVVDVINLGHQDNILQKKNKLLPFVHSNHVLTVLPLGDLKVIF